MNSILTCQACHAKNRVQNVPAGQVPVCARCGSPLPWLHEGTDATFASDIQASVPVLVDFWAPWCGPCRMMAPHYEEAAHRFGPRARFAKVNSDDEPALSARFGIRGIPTLIVFRGGKEVARQSGAMDLGTLERWLNPALT